MTQREGRLVYRPGEWYALHGILLREGDPLAVIRLFQNRESGGGTATGGMSR